MACLAPSWQGGRTVGFVTKPCVAPGMQGQDDGVMVCLALHNSFLFVDVPFSDHCVLLNTRDQGVRGVLLPSAHLPCGTFLDCGGHVLLCTLGSAQGTFLNAYPAL